MNFEIFVTDNFKKEAKTLSKKFPSLKKELIEFQENLIQNPKSGKNLGNGLFKFRLASKSKGKGKRGGFRILLLVIEFDKLISKIHLLSIYDKSELDSISEKRIELLLKQI